MSATMGFERIPRTDPQPPREPRPLVPENVRRRQLRQARRSILAFSAVNPQQARLQGVALAMIAYMGHYWCRPDRAYDFERWFRIVAYYDRALRWKELAGTQQQACIALRRILDQDQVRPCEL